MSSSRSTTSRRAWQLRESAVARFHGLERNPLSGEGSGRLGDAYDPNAEFPWVFIECKMRQKHYIAALLDDMYDKAKKITLRPSPLCVGALAEKNKPGFYLVVHSSQIIQYAIELLKKHGYTTTYDAPEEFDAAHDAHGDA